MNCELDAATQTKISELEAQLADLRTKYAELHPNVIASKKTIERAKADALTDCLRRAERPK